MTSIFARIKSKLLLPAQNILLDKNYRLKFFQGYSILVKELEREDLHLSKQELIYEDIITITSLENEQKSLNLVIPNLEPSGIFGGLASALSFALYFVENGYYLNIIYLNPKFEPQKEPLFLEAIRKYYSGKIDLSRVKLIDKKNVREYSFSENDLFIATFWTTALTINNTLKNNHFKNQKFVYMIQDFEPGFYAWSDNFALADYTYTLDFIPVFNSASLYEYISQKHPQLTDYQQHIIKPVLRLPNKNTHTIGYNERQSKRNILIYGRPSKDRNLFNVIIIGLKEWIKEHNIQPSDVNINSIGETHQEISLGNAINLKPLGKMSYDQYIDLLGKTDIGISLMMSPHPSYPPLEMALYGVKVITNRFENKQLKNIDNLSVINPYPKDLSQTIARLYNSLPKTDRKLANTDFLDGMGSPINQVFEHLFKNCFS